jgi:NitT/TauT family transport system substrate-binding protein
VAHHQQNQRHHTAPYRKCEAAAGIICPRRSFAITRRSWLAATLAGMATSVAGRAIAATPEVRLGILQFGTVQWVADVIQRNGFDRKHGFTLRTVTLANTEAGRVALMAQAADVIVSDWIFVANQRQAGTKLCFAPFSSATGGIMVPVDSPIRSLASLAGHKLGVAGGPVDKSWLIVRAAAKASAGIDPESASTVVYGAPPLLNAKLMQGELQAVLTYWNFAARLEAAGFNQMISVTDCAGILGMRGPLCLIGFVFHENWANQHPSAISGFLAAATDAESLLASSDAEWRKIRPLMNAPQDTLFNSFRRRFVDGIAHPSPAQQQRTATQLFDVLLRTGGARATGGLESLPAGIFWNPDG